MKIKHIEYTSNSMKIITDTLSLTRNIDSTDNINVYSVFQCVSDINAIVESFKTDRTANYILNKIILTGAELTAYFTKSLHGLVLKVMYQSRIDDGLYSLINNLCDKIYQNELLYIEERKRIAELSLLESLEKERLEKERWAALTEEQKLQEKLSTMTEEERWEYELNKGWTDDLSGIKLDTTEKSQSLFSNMMTLINEGLSFGQLSLANEVSIWDFNGIQKNITILELKTLLFKYGLYCKNMFDLYKP